MCASVGGQHVKAEMFKLEHPLISQQLLWHCWNWSTAILRLWGQIRGICLFIKDPVATKKVPFFNYAWLTQQSHYKFRDVTNHIAQS